jgi:hypothetical protein
MTSVSRRRLIVGWVVAAVLGLVIAASTDLSALPFSGNEKISAVFLLDGQAYFGRLHDVPWSSTVSLSEVYYFDDARRAPTDLAVALVRRGAEIHQPADGMQIRREKILAIERVSLDSAVGRAIAAQRALERPAASP